MTGQLLGDDGSGASSPAYAFDNDADTGMFRLSSNTIGFATSGTARVSVSDAGLDVVNGLPIRLQDSSGSPFVSLKTKLNPWLTNFLSFKISLQLSIFFISFSIHSYVPSFDWPSTKKNSLSISDPAKIID